MACSTPGCGRKPLARGLCSKCYARKRSADRYAAGLCAGCDAQREGDHTLCAACAAKNNAVTTRRRAEKVAAGACDSCGGPTERTTRCRKCQDRLTAQRRKRVADGRCMYCDAPRTTPSFCDHHFFVDATYRLRARAADVDGVKQLFAKQKGRCAYTGVVLVIGVNASLDHIVPRARGGTSELSNLQWVDLAVNLAKRDLSHEQFVELCHRVAEAFPRRRTA